MQLSAENMIWIEGQLRNTKKDTKENKKLGTSSVNLTFTATGFNVKYEIVLMIHAS